MPKKIQQFRSPDLSVWQSAVDEVVARSSSAAAARSADSDIVIARPDQNNSMVTMGNLVAESVKEHGFAPVVPKTGEVAKGIGETAKFCATTAFKLALAKLRGNAAEAARLSKELKVDMGPCDPKWAQVVAVFLAKKATQGTIPYRRHDHLSDFVIDGRLPSKCRVAILADWGTGDQGARLLLRQIAQKQPDVVFHLGDVYYSGTEHEFQNYFYKIWQPTLGIEKVNWGDTPKSPTTPATFTLAGNHDLYAGGVPYYTVIDMLGQPASYFALRNEHWQFLAMDTGLHDSNPVGQSATFLEDTELAWLKDKVANDGRRKNVLLSHHQLFSRFESIEGQSTNQSLLSQVRDLLPKIRVWFWGHEHNLVIYEPFEGVLGRCVGHGAFPVGVDEITVAHEEVPVENVALSPEGPTGGLFQHGYLIMDLDGPDAKTTYYQFDAEIQGEIALHNELL